MKTVVRLQHNSSIYDSEATSSPRSSAKLRTTLIHSICTEKDEFEKTGVIQKPIKRQSDFKTDSVPCGWIPLIPCDKEASSCTNFWSCDQHGPQNVDHGSKLKPGNKNPALGQPVKKPSTTSRHDEEYGDPTSMDLIFGGNGLPNKLKSKHPYIRRRPKLRQGRNGILDGKLLPETVIPTHYDLFFRPVLVDGAKWPKHSTPGTVSILLEVHQPTDKISLHRDVLMGIVSAKLTSKSSNTEVPIKAQVYEEEDQIQNFELASSLTPGQYELYIEFTAVIDVDQQAGIFVANYNAPDGTVKEFLMTQMQWDLTRKVFPSFDEPRFKATFTISVARTKDYGAWSNSIKFKTEDDPENPGWTIDHFEKTPIMPPYVVVFAVFLSTDFKCTAANPGIYSKPVELCGEIKSVDDGFLKLALNTSVSVMNLIEETLKHPYEQTKVAGVAAPGFVGGMEDWGLIMYGAADISYIERVTSEFQRIDIIKLAIHEIVHSWFGNLVTCKSWHHFWLNEATTVYVTSNIVPQLHPDIRPFDFVTGVQDIMFRDIGQPAAVSGPTATNDGIIYVKGGGILRMVETFLGKNPLSQAMAEFVNRFAFKSVEQDDFFAVLDEFAQKEDRLFPGHTMKDILEPWTNQPGHPLVRVERDSSDPAKIKVTQERLNRQGEEKDNDVWVIPIYISSHKNPLLDGRKPDLWSSTPITETTGDFGPDSWYIFNADGVGFYHVLYSDEMFDLILNQLSTNHTAISAASRTALLFDYILLYRLGHVKLETALSLTKYLINELDEDVWQTFFKVYPITPIFAKCPEFQDYWFPRIQKLLDFYSVDDLGETGSRHQLKTLIFQWSDFLYHPSTHNRFPDFHAKASSVVEEWKRSGQPLSSIRPDHWQSVYCASVAYQNVSQFDFLLQVYKKSTREMYIAETEAILGALGCSHDQGRIEALLNATLDEKFFAEPEHFNYLYSTIVRNNATRGLFLEFFEEHFPRLVELYSLDNVVKIVFAFASETRTDYERDALLKLIEQHVGGEEAEEIAERVKQNVYSSKNIWETERNPTLLWLEKNK